MPFSRITYYSRPVRERAHDHRFEVEDPKPKVTRMQVFSRCFGLYNVQDTGHEIVDDVRRNGTDTGVHLSRAKRSSVSLLSG